MVSKLKAIIAYLSYSGNTKETAELIEETLLKENVEVEMHRIGIDLPISPEQYDYIFLGTFTWERGSTPDEVKDFVLEIGYKPPNIFVFGTGDTQFGGDDLFCLAASKLAIFYNSSYPELKIEQSPRGSQAKKVIDWVEGVLYGAKYNLKQG
ncbi:flavodoxin [Oceanobacillus caeni]|uniref:Flavodoxin n=1 Tax=Oceanobacillus caeni TaxID=405946 RepID=A0ABR5MKU5_9BACI|nr:MULTISPECIES: flavodoxin [Bacillaceae]KKE79249.1 flavodoxin [Bacilli bacterium VT-13-104]PZD86798.1 flavodoxin [Bacilli bacterium]KPH76494.1 flavodoxin [Oceanobacillus caeni]MBU8790645.1 flavodoxin [Oceanobacillus caeni]MCR1834098.1 flavodoxin [Oceanobacillus caeni]